jgi:hypothetical protein
LAGSEQDGKRRLSQIEHGYFEQDPSTQSLSAASFTARRMHREGCKSTLPWLDIPASSGQTDAYICIIVEDGAMRTTLDIDDNLAAKAKALAAREHTSLTRLIEEGLALRLRTLGNTTSRQIPVLPVFSGKGGLRATVTNSLSHRALLDAVDEAP